MPIVRTLLLMVAVLGLRTTGPAAADSVADATEAARLLAILLDSGRVVVGQNQDLINDSEKGFKGFTADVFATQLSDTFKARTGVDLAHLDTAAVPEMAKPLLMRLVEESKKTITSYQPAINVVGLTYKGLIPATFGTETASRFRSWSGIYLKQTAPAPLLRNEKNKADDYEAAAMERFATNGAMSESEQLYSEVVDNGKTLRGLLPLYYGQACLGCHGEPKGQRDISGYKREGGHEGQLGGAISVKLELE